MSTDDKVPRQSPDDAASIPPGLPIATPEGGRALAADLTSTAGLAR